MKNYFFHFVSYISLSHSSKKAINYQHTLFVWFPKIACKSFFHLSFPFLLGSGLIFRSKAIESYFTTCDYVEIIATLPSEIFIMLGCESEVARIKNKFSNVQQLKAAQNLLSIEKSKNISINSIGFGCKQACMLRIWNFWSKSSKLSLLEFFLPTFLQFSFETFPRKQTFFCIFLPSEL